MLKGCVCDWCQIPLQITIFFCLMNFMSKHCSTFPKYVYRVNRFSFLDFCGSYMVAIEKTQNISTPNYPQPYKSDLTCVWTITTSNDYLVKLETGFVSNDTCCESLYVSNCFIFSCYTAFFPDKQKRIKFWNIFRTWWTSHFFILVSRTSCRKNRLGVLTFSSEVQELLVLTPTFLYGSVTLGIWNKNASHPTRSFLMLDR